MCFQQTWKWCLLTNWMDQLCLFIYYFLFYLFLVYDAFRFYYLLSISTFLFVVNCLLSAFFLFEWADEIKVFVWLTVSYPSTLQSLLCSIHFSNYCASRQRLENTFFNQSCFNFSAWWIPSYNYSYMYSLLSLDGVVYLFANSITCPWLGVFTEFFLRETSCRWVVCCCVSSPPHPGVSFALLDCDLIFLCSALRSSCWRGHALYKFILVSAKRFESGWYWRKALFKWRQRWRWWTNISYSIADRNSLLTKTQVLLTSLS